MAANINNMVVSVSPSAHVAIYKVLRGRWWYEFSERTITEAGQTNAPEDRIPALVEKRTKEMSILRSVADKLSLPPFLSEGNVGEFIEWLKKQKRFSELHRETVIEAAILEAAAPANNTSTENDESSEEVEVSVQEALAAAGARVRASDLIEVVSLLSSRMTGEWTLLAMGSYELPSKAGRPITLSEGDVHKHRIAYEQWHKVLVLLGTKPDMSFSADNKAERMRSWQWPSTEMMEEAIKEWAINGLPESIKPVAAPATGEPGDAATKWAAELGKIAASKKA